LPCCFYFNPQGCCVTHCRTGRCGRAGRPGLVMNFANPETKFVARRFGKQLGVRVRDCEVRDGRVFLKGD
jgi:superfamily II DNA/RNA helicase